MSHDLIAELGGAFLGSRLKRLGERLQAEAARVTLAAGLDTLPPHIPLIAALGSGPMTVGELAERVGFSQPGVTRSLGQMVRLGLVSAARGADERRRSVSLTPKGSAALARLRAQIWPRLGAAVDGLCGGDATLLLAQLAGVEAAMAQEALDRRAARAAPAPLRIVTWRPELAREFHDLNVEWITAMFRLETADREVLEDPQGKILADGGDILFVEAAGLGIIGTGALKRGGDGGIELTKMAVTLAARGLKAGECLLAALIARAGVLGAAPLYLLTNRDCAAAIHLYEKLGFCHDAQIMERYGARYDRCDVAMVYRPA